MWCPLEDGPGQMRAELWNRIFCGSDKRAIGYKLASCASQEGPSAGGDRREPAANTRTFASLWQCYVRTGLSTAAAQSVGMPVPDWPCVGRKRKHWIAWLPLTNQRQEDHAKIEP